MQIDEILFAQIQWRIDISVINFAQFKQNYNYLMNDYVN